MRERILSARDLNRTTLARQLLLHRHQLSATQVIERLVGMQAQAAMGPYIGIWARAEAVRPEELEEDLRSGAVLKATVMRQTLHLVTRREYALLRAALSDIPFPDQSPEAVRLSPSFRRLAEPTQRFQSGERRVDLSRGRRRGWDLAQQARSNPN